MNGENNDRTNEIVASGIAIGAGGGVALGLVLMTIFDHNGFFALGIAIGASLGVTIAYAIARR